MDFNYTSMEKRNHIKKEVIENTKNDSSFLPNLFKSYILIFLIIFAVGGLGFVLFKEVQRILAEQTCPVEITDGLIANGETVDLIAGSDKNGSIINCSTVSLTIENGGKLNIKRALSSSFNSSVDDDYAVILKLKDLTVDFGGVVDLQGDKLASNYFGFPPGEQINHQGSGKTSIETCGSCTDHPEIKTKSICETSGYSWVAGFCGGSGGANGGSGGEGDADINHQNGAGSPGQSYGNENFELNPEDNLYFGSGGGTSSTGILGGAGGGAVKIEVGCNSSGKDCTGIFNLNGTISANGFNGKNTDGITGGGGGAGGSVWVEAGTITGNGSIDANGGDGGIATGNGGGGGGGRIMMRCYEANTFNQTPGLGTVSVQPGAGDDNPFGQIGTIIGPSCYPPAPINMSQWELTQTYPTEILNEITLGERTKKTVVEFRFTISDIENPSTLYPQIELREVGQAFQGAPTHTGGAITYTGTPVDVTIRVSGLSKTKEYKWNASVRDSYKVVGEWVNFGDNDDGIDFIVLGDPYQINMVSGNNQTGTVGQALSNDFVVEVIDSVGHKINDTSVSWEIIEGEGTLDDFERPSYITDTNGQAIINLILGITAGTDNNIVNAIKTGVSGSPVVFTATSNPDILHHYSIVAPKTVKHDTEFSDVYITANDQYENLITTNTNTVALTAVMTEEGCPTTCNPGNGTLVSASGLSVTLVNGEYHKNDLIYQLNVTDESESIKIKADDSSIQGYSDPIQIYRNAGNCFGYPNDGNGGVPLHITDAIFSAFKSSGENGGIIDCSITDVIIDSGVIVPVKSNDNGDTDYGNDLGVTILAKSLTLGQGAGLDADSSGYGYQRGPGYSVNGSTHGGQAGHRNGNINTNYYDDALRPTMFGSGTSKDAGECLDPIYTTKETCESNGSIWIAVSGGGHLSIIVEESLSLNMNSIISANGNNTTDIGTSYIAPSGGSIYIETNDINVIADAKITANGGSSYYGSPGAGGRISIKYNTNSGNNLKSTTIVQAFAGDNLNPDDKQTHSSAGTIYIEGELSNPKYLLVENYSIKTDIDIISKAGLPTGNYEFSTIELNKYNDLYIDRNTVITIPDAYGSTAFKGDNTGELFIYGLINLPDTIVVDNLKLRSYGEIHSNNSGNDTSNMDFTIGTVGGEMTIWAGAWGFPGGNYEFNSVDIEPNGIMFFEGFDNDNEVWGDDYGVSLLVNDLTINSGGKLSADGLGYKNGNGFGGSSNNTVGAAFGGFGKIYNGENTKIYGSVYGSRDLGSGGFGNFDSRGGGSIKLEVTDTLILDGSISSNGNGQMIERASICGGSGGSIWIIADIIGKTSENYSVTANGGGSSAPLIGNPGGPGSGGRISIYYRQDGDVLQGLTSLELNDIDLDLIQAIGGNLLGNNTFRAGPGTIYIENTGIDTPQGAYLYADGNGVNTLPAGITDDQYEFERIKLTRYGHLTVQGSSSLLTVTGEEGLLGDDTFPDLTIEGTFKGPSNLTVNGVDVGIKGELQMDGGNENSTFNLGDVYKGGLTLYAKTWAHNNINTWILGDVNVINGSMSFISYDDGDVEWQDDYGVTLTLDTLNIESNGEVTATDKGYEALKGPGAGSYGIGPVYGGYAYNSINQPYGDVFEPTALGSGGNNAGGGAFKIISNSLVNNGTITSNSYNQTLRARATGSGGSIWLDTNIISGTGTITSNGGDTYDNAYQYHGGPGSGGRIALYYDTNIDFDLNNIQSYGGILRISLPNSNFPYYRYFSGPGTIYIEDKNNDIPQGGKLFVDNNTERISTESFTSPFSATILPREGNYQFNEIKLTSNGHLQVQTETDNLGCSIGIYKTKSFCESNGGIWNGGTYLTITDSTGLNGDETIPDLIVEGTFNGPSNLTIQGLDLNVKGEIELGINNLSSIVNVGTTGLEGGLTFYAKTWIHDNINSWYLGDVNITSKGKVSLVSDIVNNYGVNLNLQNLNIDQYTERCSPNPVYLTEKECINKGGNWITGGELTASGYGFPDELGPGGSDTYTIGAVYGGTAYGSSKIPYGDVYEPIDLGSSGDFKGGGAFKLIANSIINNGRITANAEAVLTTYASGGTGGSIWIDTDNIEGSGSIYSNGANTYEYIGRISGPGSGGRIALYYENNNGFNFENIMANGGYHMGGYEYFSGPGTVYIEQKGVDITHSGKLFVNNNVIDRIPSSTTVYYAEERAVIPALSISPYEYKFDEIHLLDYGHLEVLGEGSGCSNSLYKSKIECLSNSGTWNGGTYLTVVDSSGLSGDDTFSKLYVNGTFNGPSNLTIQGLDLNVKGEIELGSDISQSTVNIGEISTGGLTLFAKTWLYNNDNTWSLGNINVNKGNMVFESYDNGNTCTHPEMAECQDDYGVLLELENLYISSNSFCSITNYSDRTTCESNKGTWFDSSSVNSDGKGYASHNGPGAGFGYNGASFGGYGYTYSRKPYGSIFGNNVLGSSGTLKGGGVVYLKINNILENNGLISANGQDFFDGYQTSGSGGTIFIKSNIITGTGIYQSIGGDSRRSPYGNYYPGSGGRISVYYSQNGDGGSLSPVSFDTQFQSYGGKASGQEYYGGPGTIYYEQVSNIDIEPDYNGNLLISNNGNYGRGMDFEPNDYTLNDLYIGDGAECYVNSDPSILPDGTSYPTPVIDSVNLTEDMVLYWQMNESYDNSCSDGSDVCDISGSENHGTSTGTSIIDSPLTKARNVDYEEQKINLKTNINYNTQIDRNGLTIATWLYFPLPSTSSGYRTIAAYDANNQHLTINSAGTIGLIRSGTWRPSTANVSNLKGWHHIMAVFTYNPNKSEFFIDGTKIAEINYITSQVIRYIGNSTSSTSDARIGKIDELIIFDKKMTDFDLNTIFANQISQMQDYQTQLNPILDQRIGKGVEINLTGNFEINTNGKLNGTGLGFSSNQGPGKGQDGIDAGDGLNGSGGGGGGHGGAGGNGQSYGIIIPGDGGVSGYDESLSPMLLGSGGGAGGTGALGGSGGSALKINALGDILINGDIIMDGQVGSTSSPGGGGGAGGSIFLIGDDVTLGTDTTLSVDGGNGGNDSNTDGGGGGGGIISINYRSSITPDWDRDTFFASGYVSIDEGIGGDGGGATGGVGIFQGLLSMPTIHTEDQFTIESVQIPLGGQIDQQAVKFILTVSDPKIGETFTPHIEFDFANQSKEFTGSNIIVGEIGSGNPATLEITVENQNQGSTNNSYPNVLGLTSDDLIYGSVYKWRARVIDGEGVQTDWVEFGTNSDNTDFAISSESCGNGIIDPGEECDGINLDGQTCIGLGFDFGNLVCDASCQYDESGCDNWVCGNGILEPANGEQCDGINFGGSTCEDFDDFDGGFLICTPFCIIDTGSCEQDPVCGNDILEPGEQCDDGNLFNGDGCNALCVIEECGNNIIDDGEECDDGNTNNNDGCSDICEIEIQICGNGSIETGEECDDGNTVNGDGCSNICLNEEVGYCGDGNIDEGEECDDSNQQNGDGCSNICLTEEAGYCGDGNIDEGEECDDDNMTNGDGCSNICQIETPLGTSCGNGFIEGTEQCDDGNNINGDGCNWSCQIEANFICGNGVVEPGEQCDQADLGNKTCEDLGFSGGDLTCNDKCLLDTLNCTNTPVCGNGIVEPGEQCDGDTDGRECTSFYGYQSGTLICSTDCKFNFEQCILSGNGGLENLPETGVLSSVLKALTVVVSMITGIFSLLFGFPSILKRRNSNPWGIIFDESTNKPVAFATVRLIQSGKIVDQKVTDLEGRYGFVVDKGTFTIEVKHDAYIVFSKEFSVGSGTSETEAINRDIGLKPIEKSKVNFKVKIKKIISDAKEKFPVISKYLYVLGLIWSTIALVLYPVLFNILVILWYIILGIIYIIQGLKRGWGRISDSETKKEIFYPVIRLFNAKDKKLIDNQIGDKKGRYKFVVKPGVYNLLVSKKGYKFPSQKENKTLKKTYFGSVIEYENKDRKTIGLDIYLDPKPKEELDKENLLEGQTSKDTLFESPFK